MQTKISSLHIKSCNGKASHLLTARAKQFKFIQRQSMWWWTSPTLKDGKRKWFLIKSKMRCSCSWCRHVSFSYLFYIFPSTNKELQLFFCVTQIIIIATKRNLWVQSFQHSPQFDWPKRGKAKSFRILWLERNLATMLFSKFVVVGYARWKKAKMRHELDRNQWGVPEVEERRPWRRSYSGSCRSLRLVNEGMKKKQLQS